MNVPPNWVRISIAFAAVITIAFAFGSNRASRVDCNRDSYRPMAPMSQAGLPLQSPDWIISPEKEVNSVDALFNVIAASFAFWLTALGTEKILRGLFGRTFVADSVGMRVTPIGLNRFVLGISLITLALLVSDLSNKFVETARDANWFT